MDFTLVNVCCKKLAQIIVEQSIEDTISLKAGTWGFVECKLPVEMSDVPEHLRLKIFIFITLEKMKHK